MWVTTQGGVERWQDGSNVPCLADALRDANRIFLEGSSLANFSFKACSTCRVESLAILFSTINMWEETSMLNWDQGLVLNVSVTAHARRGKQEGKVTG